MQYLRPIFFMMMLLSFGCELPAETIPIVHSGPEYWVTGTPDRKADDSPKSPSSVVPFNGGWITFSMDAGVTTVDSRIDELFLDELIFRAPLLGSSLDFIERMELYLPGESEESPRLIAMYEREEALAVPLDRIRLEAFGWENIKPALDRGEPFLVTLQGTPPERDTAIRSELHLLGLHRPR